MAGLFSDVPAGQWQQPMIVEQSFGHFTMLMAKVIVSHYRNRTGRMTALQGTGNGDS
jgi:hypothetical protein